MRQALVVAMAAVTLVACSPGDGRSRLTVLAASSLTDAFTHLEQTYEGDHPDIDVVLSFDSSAILAQQVIAGAPADVLATADEATMRLVAEKGLLTADPVAFASNTLALVTPADNPAGIDDVRDLESADVDVAMCAPQAPCGAATQRLLELEGTEVTAATQEDNVRSVLTKVRLGQVDAGIVYVTDAASAGEAVDTFSIGRADDVVTINPIAVLAASENRAAAQDWVDLILSEDGQRRLADFGFGTVS